MCPLAPVTLGRMQIHTPTATDTGARPAPRARSGSAYVTIGDVARMLGLSTMTLRRMRSRGEMPEPARLSPGRLAWRRDVIDTWLAGR